MEISEKKWVLDCSIPDDAQGSPKDLELPKVQQIFDVLSADSTNAPLFINSASWQTMTTKEAYEYLRRNREQTDAKWIQLWNEATWIIAVSLSELSSALDPYNEAKSAEIWENIVCTLGDCLKNLPSHDLGIARAACWKKWIEFISTPLDLLSRLQANISTNYWSLIISTLNTICNSMEDLDTVLVQTFWETFQSSPLWTQLHLQQNTTLSLGIANCHLDILLQLHRERPLNIEVVESLLADLEKANLSLLVTSLLPFFYRLARFSPDSCIRGTWSVMIVDLEAQNNSEGLSELVEKFVDEEDFLSTCAHLLLSTNDRYSEIARKSLIHWLDVHPKSTMRFLDELTLNAQSKRVVISHHPSVIELLKKLVNPRLSIEQVLPYLVHWLNRFEEISSLDKVLTKVERVSDVKPIVDLLEVGFDLLHLLTPPHANSECLPQVTKPAITEMNKEQRPLIEEVHAPSSVDPDTFSNLVKIILGRLDTPDYFYYLNETQEYDKENYSFAEIRVRTFQHLIGHFWHLLDAILSYMPPLKHLTRDNPILLLPVGVSTPIEVPLWFDALLLTMAVHGMESDFCTAEAARDVNKCKKTLLECESIAEIGKNPFALRLRSLIGHVKSNKSFDEPSRHRIIMWLCTQVPLQDLSHSDSFDSVVASAVVEAVKDVLNDHRTELKLLGIKLVIHICSLPMSDSNNSTSGASHLPQSIFDAILRSLNFREPRLVDFCLKAAILLIRAHLGEQLQFAWSSSLMHHIVYEMDYIQKPELLKIYLQYLPDILPFLQTKLISFSHPLLVRIVALLDIGTFTITKLALQNITLISSLAWPRIQIEGELIFGALAATWIDQVWVMPHEKMTETVEKNVSELRALISTCLSVLVAVLDSEKMKSMAAEIAALPELSSFYKLCTIMINAKM